MIVVFVDRKIDAALLIIPHGKRRAPIDNFEVDVALFADIVTVIPLFFVRHVHAGEIRFGKITFITAELFFVGGNARVPFENGTVVARRIIIARAQLGDFAFRRLNPILNAFEIKRLQLHKYGFEMLFFVRKLFLFVEQSKKPFLIDFFFGIQKRVLRIFTHSSPVCKSSIFSHTKTHLFLS